MTGAAKRKSEKDRSNERFIPANDHLLICINLQIAECAPLEFLKQRRPK
jgi:hypothetical protein